MKGTVAILNRLIDREVWMRGRLAPFAGHVVVLRLLPLQETRFVITGHGDLEPAADDAAASVTIHGSAGSVLASLRRPSALAGRFEFHGASNTGELQDALRAVIAGFQWDFEDDLANLVGDVAAHRIAAAVRAADRFGRESGERLISSLHEYATEDASIAASTEQVASLKNGVDRVAAAVGSLEERITALEDCLRPSQHGPAE